MHIGIDFDNTIVSYDALFHRVALEKGLVTPSVQVNKVAVRDHLRRNGLEDTWVEMQGYVYGARMQEAVIYPGFIEFLSWAKLNRHAVSIVSHKTRHPFAGPRYDLHDAAQKWIQTHLLADGRPLVPDESVFFELTKQDKFRRIVDRGCDVFIDDLPEILLASEMPANIRRVLFDPEASNTLTEPGIVTVRSWAVVRDAIDV